MWRPWVAADLTSLAVCRPRFAEGQLRARGDDTNLGALSMKEIRGESEPTWLSDPSLTKWRPNFME